MLSDAELIRQTNRTGRRAFPVVFALEDSRFLALRDQLVATFQRLRHSTAMATTIANINPVGLLLGVAATQQRPPRAPLHQRSHGSSLHGRRGERELMAQRAVLEPRAMVRSLMCDFQVELDPERFSPERFPTEWQRLGELARDGLVERVRGPKVPLLRVTPMGRWLVRTIAAVFDPDHRRQATGSRLV
jgi:hypothetical protein